MIREILPSDVEFTKGMVNSSRSDAEILTCLAARGLDPDKAAHLLDDLRHGREPEAHAQLALGSTARRTTRKPETPSPDAPPAATSAPPHSRHKRHQRAFGTWWFVIVVIIFLWAVWYAFIKSGADASKDVIDLDKHAIPAAPGKEVER